MYILETIEGTKRLTVDGIATGTADTGGGQPTGAEGSCDQFYWSCASDLLFAVRPSGQGRFTYDAINPAFEVALGLSSRDVGKLDILDYMGRDDARLISDAFRACLAEGTEVRVRHSLAFDGSRREVETTVIPVVDPVDGVIVRLIGSHRILRQEFFESGIPDKADVLLNASLPSIQEDIQQRIASELHDSTCQHLIAASLGLMRIRSHLGASAEAEGLCNEIDECIDKALKEIRAFTYLLHPQDLTVDGLKATIERYARSFAARTSLHVDTSISAVADQLPYEHQRLLLRVTQEALTNVFRHARATEVKIAVATTDTHMRLTISDNGRGLDVTHARRGAGAISTGVGIPAMRARLAQLGGTLEIHSNPTVQDSGTTINAVFAHGLATRARKRKKAATVRAGVNAR
jgi:signal transduction histidine kinase